MSASARFYVTGGIAAVASLMVGLYELKGAMLAMSLCLQYYGLTLVSTAFFITSTMVVSRLLTRPDIVDDVTTLSIAGALGFVFTIVCIIIYSVLVFFELSRVAPERFGERGCHAEPQRQGTCVEFRGVRHG